MLKYFKILKENNNIGTSYLFVGNNFSLVKKIIKIVLCKNDYFCDNCWDCKAVEKNIHPDIFVVEPKNIQISIDDVREAQNFLSFKSFRLGKKVVIVKEAQSFGLEAASAFLKTLEEPPKNSFIALCSSKLDGILPTINSRCRKIFLPFCEDEKLNLNLGAIELFFNERISFKERSEFASFLFTLAVILRDYLIYRLVGRKNLLLEKEHFVEIFKILKNADYVDIVELSGLLETILRIYSAYNSINEKLALNLLKTKFQKLNLI